MARFDVFKCNKCGRIIEALNDAAGPLACCGDPMNLMKEHTADAAGEKHVPVFDGCKVQVGSTIHPMDPDHYIEWIEVIDGDRVCRKFLKPGEQPAADFTGGACCGGKPIAREYCNKHGLWKGEK
ncbi:MAG: desulfoferrodoxin [Fretibacterium sp.]|nr:desulfoferrodoxin [Fretibacterium sp.]